MEIKAEPVRDVRDHAFSPRTPSMRRTIARRWRESGRRSKAFTDWTLQEFAGWLYGKADAGAPLLARLRPRRHPLLGQARTGEPQRRPRLSRTRSCRSAFGSATRRSEWLPTTFSPGHRARRDLREQPLRPEAAIWQPTGSSHLALLPYEEVRSSSDPAQNVLDFLQSAYDAGAVTAGWDATGLRSSWCPVTTPGRRPSAGA